MIRRAPPAKNLGCAVPEFAVPLVCASCAGGTGLSAEAQNVQCRERGARTDIRYQAQLQHRDRFEIDRVILDLAGRTSRTEVPLLANYLSERTIRIAPNEA